ncbi:MAG: hypothetical protein FGF50_11165 [Candidatus Brockarchaeota archaeon]|nr:hypothetical protein [Candidatus Brockarchaeota archaeon]
MVKLSEAEKKMSRFLSGSDVENGAIVEIADGGKILSESESGFGRPVFQITVMMPDGSMRTWTMNKTTRDRLKEAYGDDTENWVGKKVRIEVVGMVVRGTFRKVVFGHPVVGEEEEVKKARRIVENMKASGMKQASLADFERLLKISDVGMTAEQLVKLLKLKVEGGVVYLG